MDAIKINHFLRKSKARKKDGKLPVYTRISLKGGKIDLSTGIHLSIEEWDPFRQIVKDEVEESERLNRILHKTREKLYESEQTLIRYGEEVTATSVRDQAKGQSRIGKRLIEAYEEHNN